MDGAHRRRRRPGGPPRSGLAAGASTPPLVPELDAAFQGVDLVVVENLCTIPLTLPAAHAVAAWLTGDRPCSTTTTHPGSAASGRTSPELPPTDPAWRHVTINHLTEGEMAARGSRRPRSTTASTWTNRGDRAASRGRPWAWPTTSGCWCTEGGGQLERGGDALAFDGPHGVHEQPLVVGHVQGRTGRGAVARRLVHVEAVVDRGRLDAARRPSRAR